MGISGVSSPSSYDSLASLAGEMKAGGINLQISTAILKQAMDVQQQQAEALVKMIQANSSLEGTGQIVDLRI